MPRTLADFELGLARRLTASAVRRIKRRGGELVEPAPRLPAEKLAPARLFPDRRAMVSRVPRGLRVGEVGTEHGHFAKFLFETLAPRHLTIVDLSLRVFDRAWSAPLEAQGRVTVLEGNSAEVLARLPDASFDFLYVDGGHNYAAVAADLAQGDRLVSREGLIVCNDYTPWSPNAAVPYGVPRAVHEHCLTRGWSVVGLALHELGYLDIALARDGVTLPFPFAPV